MKGYGLDIKRGFRQGLNAEYCVLVILVKFIKKLGDKATLLTNLPKVFDCLPHNLIIYNLYACGLDLLAVGLIDSYLRNRHQRLKTDNSYSLWKNKNYIVQERSVLVPILLNSFLCDLLFDADDNCL